MAGPTLAAGNVLRMRAWFTIAEQAAVATWCYKVGTITGSLVLSDVAISFDSIMHVKLKAMVTSQARYNGIQCYLLNTLPLPRPQDVTANAGACTAGPIALPRQSTGITSWFTDFAGPGNRGRTYWPFPPASGDETIGEPNAAYIAAVDDVCGDLKNNIVFTGSGGSANGILSLFVKRTPTAPIPIREFLTHPKYATQKRRGSYGRTNASPI